MRGPWIAVAALLVYSARAQQPAGTQMFVNYPGLSDSCKTALATNVTCPPFLVVVSPTNRLLDTDEVTELCTDDCYTTLQSARDTIKAACTLDTDVIVYENVAYPATFIADHYLLTYDASCQKNSTGNYCDPQLLLWTNQSTWPDENPACSECWLSTLAAQLNNPLGYDDAVAADFNSLTSSCNATGYSYTSPTAYALNTTATATPTSVSATPTSTPTCVATYEVQVDDDCNSVAKAMNVSTYYLLEANNLDLYCQTFANQVGKTLCIPSQCTTYTWGPYDTCDDVVTGLEGVTLPQFFAWNPNFNSLCLNTPLFLGYEICVSPPGGYLDHGSGNDSIPTMPSGSTSVVAPTNAVEGSNRNCSLWYTVVEGDTCARVSLAQSISLTDFYFLNPEIDENCSNLLLGEAYCVKPVGSITSYQNYTITGVLPITVTSATFSSVNTDIPTSTSDPGFIYTPPPLPPAAPGTFSDCYEYYATSFEDTPCNFLALMYQVFFADLVLWNPSLEDNQANCTLSTEYSYCVKLYENSTIPDDTSNCLSREATEPGTASNCNCFTYVDSYDYGDYTCDDFLDSYDITLSQLLAWNTWLAEGDCDTALFANLGALEDRSVCVGVNSTSVTPTPTLTSTGSTTTTNSMGPTQTGVVDGCQLFYTVQDGDTCPSIESQYSITAAQFYAWNPTIGGTCTNLWLGYAYCVKGPASSTTTTGPDNPTQTGIASNCNVYHNVVSGDSCAAIEEMYGITFAQLYEWNPAIGSDCELLQIGYSVCVGVAS